MKEPRQKPPVQEPPPIRHPFAKGGHFENMKGTYEVVSLSGATMRIRWENGEEIDTDVEFQERILDRFNREVRAARLRPGLRTDDELEVPFGPRFRGLTPTDFSLDVTRTAWRSRTGGIGGAVTHELGAGDHSFGFWVPFRQPTILWTDVDKEAKHAAQVETGFFCRLNETQACYGFFVGRPTEGEVEETSNWRRFLEWLDVPGHEEWLHSLAEDNALRIVDSQEPASFLQSSKGVWIREDAGGRTEVPRLRAFFADRPLQPRSVLEISAWIEKDRAVQRAVKLASDIAQLFESLLPVYRASLGLEEETKPSSKARARATSSTPARGRVRASTTARKR